ncbi:MAG: hypothetical protein ACIAXF_08665 [Phycisphaerales bacterium JB063]
MPNTLDPLMQTASQALSDGDYPRCESLCIKALAHARAAQDWTDYARVVLPLQESRRLKRQAALEGRIRLGTADGTDTVVSLLEDLDAGCLVITAPLTAKQALACAQAADDSGKPIEVLYADPVDADTWTIRGLSGAGFEAPRPAPNAEWQSRWVPGGPGSAYTPAHWWMQASEALGDAALASISAPPGTTERVGQIESALSSVGDHELLHQALADAARAVQHTEVR